MKHKHSRNVTVVLADFASEVRIFPDGKWILMHRASGTAVWSEAAVHEVRMGSMPSHTIRIELKC